MTTPAALLQPEILEIIFKNLDGFSLWKCEHVCRTWKDVLHHHSMRSDTWKRCCKREIPEDVLLETVYNHCSLVQLEKKSINWQVVYKDWLQWLSLRSWRYVARCVFTAENRKESITCFRMSGNCVITGHPNGSIKLWDRYKCFLGEINSHLRDVTDLDLMKYEDFSEDNDAWNLKHNLVISTSIDRSIQVNCIVIGRPEIANVTVHTAATTMIRTYRNMFAVLSKDSRISIWKIDGLCPSAILLKIVVMMEQPECINVWKGEFSGFTVSGIMFEIIRDYSENLIVSYPDRLGTKGGRMKKGFIWRRDICAWLSTNNHLHVHLGNNSAVCYDTMSYLGSYPVTLLLYANIFILGMESGEVVMYYIKTPEELRQLDLGNFQRKIKLSSDPIVSLDVQETDQGPCVAAATSTSLFSISFLISQNVLLEKVTS